MYALALLTHLYIYTFTHIYNVKSFSLSLIIHTNMQQQFLLSDSLELYQIILLYFNLLHLHYTEYSKITRGRKYNSK